MRLFKSPYNSYVCFMQTFQQSEYAENASHRMQNTFVNRVSVLSVSKMLCESKLAIVLQKNHIFEAMHV